VILQSQHQDDLQADLAMSSTPTKYAIEQYLCKEEEWTADDKEYFGSVRSPMPDSPRTPCPVPRGQEVNSKLAKEATAIGKSSWRGTRRNLLDKFKQCSEPVVIGSSPDPMLPLNMSGKKIQGVVYFFEANKF